MKALPLLLCGFLTLTLGGCRGSNSHKPTPHKPMPEAVLDIGEGCTADELPASLSAPAPATGNSVGESVEQKTARQKITACLLHKLYPAARMSFGWDDKGEGRFDLVFPDNAFGRASWTTFTRIPSDGGNLETAALLWLNNGEHSTPVTLVMSRNDESGTVSYHHSVALDPQARISDDTPPQWKDWQQDELTLEWRAVYGEASQRSIIDWEIAIDSSNLAITRQHAARVQTPQSLWQIADHGYTNAHWLATATNSQGERHELNLACQGEGESCRIDAAGLLSQLQ